MNPIKSDDFFTEDMAAAMGVPRELYRRVESFTITGSAHAFLSVTVTFTAYAEAEADVVA